MLHLKKMPFFLASMHSHTRTWPSRLSLPLQLRPAHHYHLPRIKYPRVLLGLLFLLLLIAILFAYSATVPYSPPYLIVPAP